MRKPEYQIEHIFLDRWSPRALSEEPLEDRELMSLFEAAKWAPSSYNNQPWRFIYARKGTGYWDDFFSLLTEGNKIWARKAAVLAVVASKKTFDYDGRPSITHSFDTGAAWENLALQASKIGVVAHGMQGFDYEKARDVINLPGAYAIEAMIAIGKPGKKEDLPEQLQQEEFPSDRKGLKDIVFEGIFEEVKKNDRQKNRTRT